jgi:hypothetical protein
MIAYIKAEKCIAEFEKLDGYILKSEDINLLKINDNVILQTYKD